MIVKQFTATIYCIVELFILITILPYNQLPRDILISMDLSAVNEEYLAWQLACCDTESKPDNNHQLGRNSGPKCQHIYVRVYVRVCMAMQGPRGLTRVVTMETESH
jgi:hypothetical protein